MSTLIYEARRAALLQDTIAALDFAESIHRGLGAVTAERVALDADTFASLGRHAETVYGGLCRMRQLIEGAA